MSESLIEIPERLLVFAEKPKRFKILIGGRGSAKSESVAALISAMVDQSGCRAVCCREFQTSIKQSVHSLVKRKIKALDLEDGFEFKDTSIVHKNGGEIIYQGLSRDPEAIKSVDDAELCWVEEAQSLSKESLEQLTPSIRGRDAELWFTANLGSSADPFSQKFIKPFEKELRRDRFYEDDLHLIVWINYDENPWFPAELEMERASDYIRLPRAEYNHKWLGEYNDTVDNALIQPDWFDSAIDAHKKLGFKARGIEVVAHDPSDSGDAKGLAHRHGPVFLHVEEWDTGDINSAADKAADYAHKVRPDFFIWDGDGMGIGLRRQIGEAIPPQSRTLLEIFRGSNSPDRPDDIYGDEHDDNRKTNADTFRNKRAQYYWELRERFRKTYLAVTHGDYYHPDDLISISSEIKGIDLIRSEVCRVPTKHNGVGKIQIMTKAEMKVMKIDSPGMADSMMMSLATPPPKLDRSPADLMPEPLPDY